MTVPVQQGGFAMVDTYTKAVLTVIALALVALVMRSAAQPAIAMSECGTFTNPCYVTARSGDALNVKIVTR
jgi:hypothetical protein